MAFKTLKHTLNDSTPTQRLTGTLKLRERAQATLQVESGSVRLVQDGDDYTDPGVVLSSGGTFTEIFDPADVFVTMPAGTTAVVQVAISGAVSA